MFKVETLHTDKTTTTVKVPKEYAEAYIKGWHPAGYGTKIKEITEDGYAIIFRFNSCD